MCHRGPEAVRIDGQGLGPLGLSILRSVAKTQTDHRGLMAAEINFRAGGPGLQPGPG